MADFDVVFKGGTVINADGSKRADVGIRGEMVEAVGEGFAGTEEIDASGKYVIPGGIDPHVHFALQQGAHLTADDFDSGTRAAACGGVTTVLDFATPDPGQGLVEAVEKRRAQADGSVCIDYGLHACITDWDGTGRDQMVACMAAGVPSFKMFMIYREHGWMAEDRDLYEALETSRDLKARILVHAESAALIDFFRARVLARPDIKELGARAHALSRPNVTEWEAVARAVNLAEASGGRLYVVHLSTARGAEFIRDGRKRGVDVIGETCPPYVLLDESVFDGRRGHDYATCPQVKKKEDSAGLWRAMTEGWVSVLGTDSCTFTMAQKDMWNGDFTKIPFGMPGVETRLALSYSAGVVRRGMSVQDWVGLVSTNAARVFGLYPKKGVIEPGADADIVIWDPRKKTKIDISRLATPCDWNPYQGFPVEGAPILTLSRGKIVARDGTFTGQPKHGRFLFRN